MAQREGRRPASDSPESAARFVRRSASAGRARDVRQGSQPVSPFRAECLALVRWAELARKIVPFGSVERLPCVAEGAEHRVYHDHEARRAVKVTLRGQFGHSVYAFGYTATPYEYLSRLAWHNALFGDVIRMIGVSYDGEKHVEVIHSQPWIPPHEIRPAPFPEEIDQYFAGFGFHRAGDASVPLFYNEHLGLVVADAHEANIIRDRKGTLVVIDVVTGTPGPTVLAELRRRQSE